MCHCITIGLKIEYSMDFALQWMYVTLRLQAPCKKRCVSEKKEVKTHWKIALLTAIVFLFVEYPTLSEPLSYTSCFFRNTRVSFLVFHFIGECFVCEPTLKKKLALKMRHSDYLFCPIFFRAETFFHEWVLFLFQHLQMNNIWMPWKKWHQPLVRWQP